MNDMPDNEHEKDDRLLRLLEAVTAPRDKRGPSHLAERDEYADLRETWLAFGRLLETASEAQAIESRCASGGIEAGSASKEIKLMPRSLAERPALSDSIDAHVASHQRQVWRLRRFAAILAVAAAACGILLELGGVGLNWWLARAGRQINQGFPVAGPAQPNAAPQPAAPQAPVPGVVQNNATTVEKKASIPKQSTARTSTWNDAVDEEITSVSQEIDSVQQSWRHRVDDADLVQYRIDEVSAGMSGDGL